jgi:hypothetical protein
MDLGFSGAEVAITLFILISMKMGVTMIIIRGEKDHPQLVLNPPFVPSSLNPIFVHLHRTIPQKMSALLILEIALAPILEK